jgi:hypothetical protein
MEFLALAQAHLVEIPHPTELQISINVLGVLQDVLAEGAVEVGRD